MPYRYSGGRELLSRGNSSALSSTAAERRHTGSLSFAFSPVSRRAYTANHESNLGSVLDPATDTVLATVPVGTSPHSLAVHPQRPLVANVNYETAFVTMIDTTVDRVVATIPWGATRSSSPGHPTGGSPTRPTSPTTPCR